ncbi:SIS domain-containing protein [Auraticoccus sp. F435]|uniref:SIS domain-containing protein n=2 Tax=Auraticoccus cholistanensis TaxID=2656650 RepID=A0A6A9V1V6_9ACTN|nr:SIS domain-containing protein [Auraticoccus cholistanensis]MVA77575.1 SIS domain-containing protein [Auraticoccus cholistanensis]
MWRQVAADVAGRRQELDEFLRPWLERPGARIVLTGAGTSAYAGEVVAAHLSARTGRRVEAVATTDLVADPRHELLPDVPTLLVSFARSGQSPESLAATQLADQVLTEVGHLVLTCNPDGQLAADHGGRPGSLVLLMPEGSNDQSFAMTSSFTSMTLATLLAFGVAQPDHVEPLAAAAEDLLAREAEVEALAALAPGRVVYLGSGALHGLARESALKLLELTAGRVVAWSESSLGFRHGPKAVLTPATLAVVYLSNDPYTRRYDLDIVTELVGNLGPERVVAVDAADGAAPAPGSGRVVGLRGTATLPDPVWGLAGVLVAQLVGQASSLALGLVPDNPFPTGEVNRVVQGVTIHPLD